MRLGIIGATGWLGGALTRALIAGGLGPATDLVLLNRSGARPAEFDLPRIGWARNADDLVARSEAVVVSVRPEDFAALHLRAPGRLVVSLMAGVPLAALEETTRARVVRAMPNAAAELGRSYTPWLAGAEVADDDRAFARALLARIGTEDEVGDEGQIDYLTALSGSGAAYPALLAAVLLSHARARGLPDRVALRAVEAVVCDGADLLRGRIGSASDLVETYRAYQGTTAAGLEAAEKGGFPESVASAVEAATRKAGHLWTGQGT